MIYDSFEHVGMENYFQSGSSLHKALSFVIGFDRSLPDGRYEIEPDKLYALVSSYETSPIEQRRFEAHRKYIDVQALIEGEERIDVSLLPNLKVLQEYSETKDASFHEPPKDCASLVMLPGYFAIFFPHDVHRTNCNLSGTRHVRKIVVKVRVE